MTACFLEKSVTSLANRTFSIIITRIIKRSAQTEVIKLPEEFPAVGVLGPRQVGKTTLAEEIAELSNPKPVCLELENPTEQAKLSEPESYFELHKGKLVILDEIGRTP